MTRLKTFATAIIATATIAGATAPVASAKPMTCAEALVWHDFYMGTGYMYLSIGSSSTAAAYFGRAHGVLQAAC